MVKKLVIGCSSSSGSTILSDLLDSTPYSACGQELEIFSNKRLLSGAGSLLEDDSICSLKTKRTKIRKDRLHGYGVNIDELLKKAEMTGNSQNFINWFAEYFLSLRGKKNPWLFVEKTPVNVHNIDGILELDDETNFLFMVRDPLFACTSMRKRGFSWYFSCGTWLLTAASYYKFIDHPRVSFLRYEDFVEKPYTVASNLLQDLIGVSVEPEMIKEMFKNNLYRKFRSQKISSWSINQYGKIENANNRKINRESVNSFRTFLDARVNEKFAKHFGIAPIGFREAMELFNYPEPKAFNGLEKKTNNYKNLKDTNSLLIKFFLDFMKKDASLNLLESYMNPIIFE